MNGDDQAPALLFIGGHRKCGTSMFFNLFDGHPRLCAYPTDLNLLYAYFPPYLEADRTASQRRARLQRILFEELRREGHEGLDVDAMEAAFFSGLQDDDLVRMDVLIPRLLRAFRGVSPGGDGEPVFSVVKETSSEIYAASLFEWFPDARFIHLVRDPRDNYAALKSGVESYYSALGEGDAETLASLINRSLIGMRAASINRQRYGEQRYLVLRFEDLVSDPRRSMEQVSSFLDIEFDESLLMPTRGGEQSQGNSFEGISFKGVSARNANRWRERISEREAQIIEFYFDAEMRSFDYEPEYSQAQRMDAVAEFYKWSNYRYFFSDRFADPAQEGGGVDAG